jgi:hypothetical protein
MVLSFVGALNPGIAERWAQSTHDFYVVGTNIVGLSRSEPETDRVLLESF